MGNIDAYLKKLQDEQKQEKEQEEQSDAICSMCGRTGATLYCATEQDTWVKWRKVYKAERKRLLCPNCVTIYSPSLNLFLEKKDRARLREISVFDENGKLLPHIFKDQLELVPHYFPASYLAERGVPVTLTRKMQIADAIVLTLIPEEGYHYWIDYFARKYGYIYTCVHKRFPLQIVRLPRLILFTSYFDRQDRFRLSIDYNPVIEEK